MSETISLDKTIRVRKGRSKKILRSRGFSIFLVVAVLSVLIIGATTLVTVVLPAQRVYGSIQNIMGTVKEVSKDLQNKDLTNIDQNIAKINSELDVMNEELDRFQFLGSIEFTKGYYDNLQTIRQLSDRTSEFVNKVLPELKEILGSMGYQVNIESVDLALDVAEADKPEQQDEMSVVIQELPKIIALYEDSEDEIIELIEIFNQIDPDFIPRIGSTDYAGTIRTAQSFTSDFSTISEQMKNTLRMVPDLLGAGGSTRYLVIFQNEKEMRASGGLLSAYGLVTVKNGELVGDINVTDMWDLEGYVSYTLGVDVGYRNIYGQNVLMNRGCGSTYLRAQDSGIYPDLNLTMNMFKKYYDTARKYSPKKYPAYDHIIIINTFFASDLVELIEPIKVPGYPNKVITSQNVAKEIFSVTSKSSDPRVRKSFIGEVATVAKDRFTDMSASELPKVLRTLISTIQAKNIAFASSNKEMQSYFDELGLSGRIEKSFDGDYFHLNEAQNCSLKSNFYVTDTVTTDITIAANNRISKVVKVNWRNAKVFDPKERNIYSANPSYTYRAWIRIMAPKGTNFTGSDGYNKSGYLYYTPQKYFDNKMQKQISDNIIQFDHRRLTKSAPVRTHSLTVKYTLPKYLDYSETDGYRLLIQKHPGKKAEPYKINIKHNGNVTSTEFKLERDMVLTYREGVIKLEPFDTRLDGFTNFADELEQILTDRETAQGDQLDQNVGNESTSDEQSQEDQT